MYRVGLEGILGLRRRGANLSLHPCLPQAWPGFDLTYRFGAATYNIHVTNGPGPDVISTDLDSRRLAAPEFPLVDDGQTHSVHIVLGQP